VRAASVGTATITATTKTTPELTAQVQVTVSAGGQVTGVVIDGESQQPIANATVSFSNVGRGELGQVVTGTDGRYTSPELGDILTLDIAVQATGYVSTTAYLNGGLPGPGQTITIEPIPLVHQSASPGGISGTVRNARTNEGIAGANVTVYQGMGVGAIIRPAVQQTTSDADGAYAFTGLAAGTYLVVADANTFTSGERTGIAVGNGSTTPDQDVVLSPSGAQDIRVVLTWGANPSDLDAHLTGPNADPSRFHVFWDDIGSFDSAPFAGLDVDDVSSFGPETITITRMNSGVYRYSVHDYTDRESASSSALGGSGAKVELYFGGQLQQTFFVPNQAGTLWTVFELSGSITSPTVTAVNSMTFVEEPTSVQSVHRAPGAIAADAAVIKTSARAKSPAR
jgi:hypothetical protein